MIVAGAGDHQRAAGQVHRAGPAGPASAGRCCARSAPGPGARSAGTPRRARRLRSSASSTLDAERAGEDQIEVVAAARQVVELGQSPAAEHPDAGGAAADVDDRAVRTSSSAWAALTSSTSAPAVQPGGLQHVAAGPAVPDADARRVGGRGRVQRHAQRRLRLVLQLAHGRGGGGEVDHHPVPDRRGADLVEVHRLDRPRRGRSARSSRCRGRHPPAAARSRRPPAARARAAASARNAVDRGHRHGHRAPSRSGRRRPRQGRASKASRLMLIRCSGVTLSEVRSSRSRCRCRA